jgi:nucleoside-diphosphate-sugar epimerase
MDGRGGVTPAPSVDDGAVLVLGASGQIGRSVVEQLVALGRPVIALCRKPPSDIAFGADWLARDLTRSLDLAPYRPAAVIHATGAWLLPAHLASLRAAGVRRLVCFSSTSMLAKVDSASAAERDVARRLAAAEAAVADGAIPWTVLRPTLIYGLGLDRNVTTAANFIRRWHFFPLGGPGKGLRQPVHAGDLAAVAVRLLGDTENLGRQFNIGGAETLTYRSMIERIFRALDLPPRFLRMPLLSAIPGRVGAVARRMEQDLAFDNGEVWARLGLTPREFLAGGRGDIFPGS